MRRGIGVMKAYGVIMAGGSGTRFWPLSRKDNPKQFLELRDNKTMLRSTMDRLSPVIDAGDVFVVTGDNMVELTRESLGRAIADDHILAEPAARNTAPCIGYAAMEITKKYGDGIMAIFASDHYIRDEEAFRDCLKKAIALAEEGNLVTIGIKPTKPSTGYGYIRKKNADSNKVVQFVEKPDLETAIGYLQSGDYLWNSGMFIWKASVILEKFKMYLPDVYEDLTKIGEAMNTENERKVIEEVYPDIQKISVDYGIMEKAEGILVIDGDFGWTDVGSLDALEDVLDSDDDGNTVLGNAALMDARGNVVRGRDNKLTAVIGTSDLMIIDTKDVLLVCPKDRAQDVKKLLESLEGDPKEKFF